MGHIHEKYDFTVGLFIVFKGKVLMVNHPRYDLWLAPGGHVELDEDTDQALFRELEEETGYKPEDVEILSSKPDISSPGRALKPLFTPNYMDVHEANAPHKHIVLIYFLKARHGRNVISGEHLEERWMTPEEMESSGFDIPADTMFFAKEAIKAAA